MLQQLNDAFERLGLTQGKRMLFALGQCCVDAPSFAMVTSLVVLSVAVGPIHEGVLAEATNYVHNLINLFTYMCVPNGDANYYYLEQWIVHMHKDPQYHSSMTNNHSIIVVTNCLCEAKELEAEARSDLESTKSDPSNAIVMLKNILASN
ncbi:uncharacterized protein ACA1_371190 [Acanthamoeba castellanii str. Neff]|uniref:Uncharacterized protein n=1 Tax=Acanthamoeba castellanii (strain ATCC 30010 / Neff) TaxID=1257118 RepID=L8GYD9_ACACF|nr:uncharacterized protein ACA1_371190 [Acanthamoeba castellanii str. Neff]ELR18294.1 hypothetical protein ACA1_371190 [Acanthamoeba castellanii str. Neff]